MVLGVTDRGDGLGGYSRDARALVQKGAVDVERGHARRPAHGHAFVGCRSFARI